MLAWPNDSEEPQRRWARVSAGEACAADQPRKSVRIDVCEPAEYAAATRGARNVPLDGCRQGRGGAVRGLQTTRRCRAGAVRQRPRGPSARPPPNSCAPPGYERAGLAVVVRQRRVARRAAADGALGGLTPRRRGLPRLADRFSRRRQRRRRGADRFSAAGVRGWRPTALSSLRSSLSNAGGKVAGPSPRRSSPPPAGGPASRASSVQRLSVRRWRRPATRGVR